MCNVILVITFVLDWIKLLFPGESCLSSGFTPLVTKSVGEYICPSVSQQMWSYEHKHLLVFFSLTLSLCTSVHCPVTHTCANCYCSEFVICCAYFAQHWGNGGLFVRPLMLLWALLSNSVENVLILRRGSSLVCIAVRLFLVKSIYR